jgi:hypothetical protein
MRQEEKEKGFSSSLPILRIEVCFLLASNERGGAGERFLFFCPRSSNRSLLSLGFQWDRRRRRKVSILLSPIF